MSFRNSIKLLMMIKIMKEEKKTQISIKFISTMNEISVPRQIRMEAQLLDEQI